MEAEMGATNPPSHRLVRLLKNPAHIKTEDQIKIE